MSKIYVFMLLAMFSICILFEMLLNKYENNNATDHLSVQIDTLIVERDTINWDTFIEALMYVESKGDSLAVGKNDDVGVLQITPILLKDANRILGENKYKLSDRISIDKSIEIFNVIQGHYNPEHDPHLALKIWNSKAPISYHRDVMGMYEKMVYP